jgi:hypothetical protein
LRTLKRNSRCVHRLGETLLRPLPQEGAANKSANALQTGGPVAQAGIAADAGGGGGSGSGSGAYTGIVIAIPAASYSYSVGTAGSAGRAGIGRTVGAGGTGGAGYIIVEEFY